MQASLLSYSIHKVGTDIGIGIIRIADPCGMLLAADIIL